MDAASVAMPPLEAPAATAAEALARPPPRTQQLSSRGAKEVHQSVAQRASSTGMGARRSRASLSDASTPATRPVTQAASPLQRCRNSRPAAATLAHPPARSPVRQLSASVGATRSQVLSPSRRLMSPSSRLLAGAPSTGCIAGSSAAGPTPELRRASSPVGGSSARTCSPRASTELLHASPRSSCRGHPGRPRANPALPGRLAGQAGQYSQHRGEAERRAASPRLSSGSWAAARGGKDSTKGALSASSEALVEEAAQPCRGAFDMSRTTCKAPTQIMHEVQRALAMQRVTHKKASAFLVRCEKHGLRFEVELSRHLQLTSSHVVRFRRLAGSFASCRELCSRVLAEMRL